MRLAESSMDERAPWNLEREALLKALQATPTGLRGDEAERRRLQYGPNNGLLHRRRPLWRQIIDRLSNPLVLILLFASGIAASAGETTSFFIIVVIILLSVVLDVVQQRRAENTVDALRRSVGIRAKVLRDGREQKIPIEELVPGDIVHLAAGDIVPADCRLISARDFFVNQAMLTGEPYPVEKHATDLRKPADSVAAAENFVFMGSPVISGMGTAIVCRTGQSTEVGDLARSLASQRPPDAFEHGIRRFGLLIMRLTVFLVLFVLAANVLFHRPWLETLLFALALAVGLTPELLPMVVTVTLARGAQRLAARRVIVKRLAAVHDLGAMDVLCTDKTGTLTEARIALVHSLDPSGRDCEAVFRLAYLNSVFESGIKSPLDDAILEHRKIETAAWRKIDEVPFDFGRRRVSVLIDDGSQRLLVVKGAPEDIIGLSADYDDGTGSLQEMDDNARRRILGLFEGLSEQGYRALGVASRVMDRNHDSAAVGDEDKLTFAGFVVFLDPPKADAKQSLQALVEAGIEVKILTGDNERITRHICKEIGMPVRGVLVGHDLAEMSEEALLARVTSTNLFCRITPHMKERVLLALKRSGAVVGFLGDGVNDASALHAADVGISVHTAVDIAREAADLVLLERELDVIRDGVMEGRRTVENVTKYILMGSSSNLGNMVSMAGAALFLPFLPMLPTQVLLNNLLYDLSEVGVPFDNVDPEATEKPVRWDITFIERFMLVLGPVSSIFDFLTFYALIKFFDAGEALFQTGWFVESLATQILVVFIIRTRHRPWRSRPHPVLAALSLGALAAGLVIPITPIGTLFGFVAPPSPFYAFLIGAVAGYLLLVELIKGRHRRSWEPASSPTE
jgi:Mg2+-importing ATPase